MLSFRFTLLLLLVMLLLFRRSVANSIKFFAPTGPQRQKINFADVFFVHFASLSASSFFYFWQSSQLTAAATVATTLATTTPTTTTRGNSNSRKRAASYSIKSSLNTQKQILVAGSLFFGPPLPVSFIPVTRFARSARISQFWDRKGNSTDTLSMIIRSIYPFNSYR